MRISDWSSDVCSSDLATDTVPPHNWPVALFILLLLALPGAVQWLPGASAWNSAAESSTQERSEEHTSELQSLMRISYAVFCLKKKNNTKTNRYITGQTYSQHNTIHTSNNNTDTFK